MRKTDPLDYFPPDTGQYESLTRRLIKIMTLVGILMIVVLFLLTGGCITATKQAINEYQHPPTPTPTPTPVPTFAPLTTAPTPAPRTYQMVASEYQEGVRPLNYPFSFTRYNVSGGKDMKVHFKVYNYRILPDGYTWRAEEIGQYLYQPAPAGMDYLLIFINATMDDAYGDPRMYLPDSSHFSIQIGDNLYPEDTEYQKNIRIKELEDVYNDQDSYRSRPYGYEWQYVPSADEKEAYEDEYLAPNAGIVAYKRLYLRAGVSNAEDGYIIYPIPENRTDPILVTASFNAFGDAAWLLE